MDWIKANEVWETIHLRVEELDDQIEETDMELERVC